MNRQFYELRRIRHGFDSEILGTFTTETQARTAMDSWRKGNTHWHFRISVVSVEVVHDDKPAP